MAAAVNQPKWEGSATAELSRSAADEVWPLIQDFCNHHKWLPTIDTCHRVEEDGGRGGLVRYCAATLPDGGGVKWCRERLLSVDPEGKWLRYEVLENNMGFRAYESTIKVVAMDGGDAAGGCRIVWSFLADPVEGLRYEDLVGYIDGSLQGIARNMETALLESSPLGSKTRCD